MFSFAKRACARGRAKTATTIMVRTRGHFAGTASARNGSPHHPFLLLRCLLQPYRSDSSSPRLRKTVEICQFTGEAKYVFRFDATKYQIMVPHRRRASAEYVQQERKACPFDRVFGCTHAHGRASIHSRVCTARQLPATDRPRGHELLLLPPPHLLPARPGRCYVPT